MRINTGSRQGWWAASVLAALPCLALGAVPIAPGGAGAAAAAARCPVFQWRADGAVAVELEVYRLQEDAGLVGPVLRTTVAAPASAWTPGGGQCLAGGRHAWSVRSLPDGAWSAPQLFEVAGAPSDAELAAAVEVIERYLSGRGAADTDAATPAPARLKGGTDVTAVQGVVPDPSGSTRGVHGSVASPAGVGVLAENTHPSGFDLQLGGPVPARLSEREWRLDSPTPQSLNFSNPSGPFTLQVQGSTVVTSATDQNTTYAAGNQLALAGTTFNVVEGPGSGLDADTLDGSSSAAFAPAAHNHFGQTWTGGGTLGLAVESTTGVGLEGRSTLASGAIGFGVRGFSSTPTGAGIVGSATAATGTARGVLGVSFADAGVGGMFANLGGGPLLAAGSSSTLSLANASFVVENNGEVRATSFDGDGRALTGVEPSLFRTFGGNGSNGALTVATTASAGLRRQYTTLTINAGATLNVPTFSDGRALIAVQGRCTIRGTINARGAGAYTGVVDLTGSTPGVAGRNVFLKQSRSALPNCVSGAGGAGGSVPGYAGGDGGGAESDGGRGSLSEPGGASESWKRLGVSGGAFGVRDGATYDPGFAAVLACPGATGGTGAELDDNGSNGSTIPHLAGAGGGVVYLECGELDFPASGVIDSRGTDGRFVGCISNDCSFRDAVGGDGGGGGGVVLIRTRRIIDQAGQILVAGGAGADGDGWLAQDGGDGAAGYADVVLVD